MEIVRINKINTTIIQYIKIHQTGLIIGVESWVSPCALLKDIKNNNPDYKVQNYNVQIHIDSENENDTHIKLYLYNVNGIEFF